MSVEFSTETHSHLDIRVRSSPWPIGSPPMNDDETGAHQVGTYDSQNRAASGPIAAHRSGGSAGTIAGYAVGRVGV